MKYILPFLLAICFLFNANGQEITYEEFKGLIPDLQSENWKSAYEKSGKLLESTQNDSSDLRAIVTYMNIFSAAGMVTQDQMTHEAFLKNANRFVGQRLLMAAHPVAKTEGSTVNQTLLKNTDTGSEGFTTACNSKGTFIFCFEKFQFSDKINPEDFAGTNVRCGGILTAVETNPNKSKIWISRLTISNATLRKL
jgi:hypothetical protein